MKTSGSGIVLLMILFLCVACLVLVNENARKSDFTFVDAGTAFVYPVNKQVVLVTEKGEYNIFEPLQTGCYELIPAQIGQERGTARFSGLICDQ